MLPLTEDQFRKCWATFTPHFSTLKNFVIKVNFPVYHNDGSRFVSSDMFAGLIPHPNAVSIWIQSAEPFQCFPLASRNAKIERVSVHEGTVLCHLVWQDDQSPAVLSGPALDNLGYEAGEDFRTQTSGSGVHTVWVPTCLSHDVRDAWPTNTTYFAIFNWLQSSGIFTAFAGALQGSQEERWDVRSQIMSAFGLQWSRGLADHDSKAVAMEFVDRAFLHIFLPLQTALARYIRSAEPDIHAQALDLLYGPLTDQQWAACLKKVITAASALCKLQGHWWMMYCAPGDGRLCVTSSQRHSHRVGELAPQVPCIPSMPSLAAHCLSTSV